MTFFTELTSLIIPTKNRFNQIEKTLTQISELNNKFYEIIIIDSSNQEIKTKVHSLIKKFKFIIHDSEPSTSKQRNIGIDNKSPETKYIMFLDDDLTFDSKMFKEMNNTIIKYKDQNNVVGFGFNQDTGINKNMFIEKLKKFYLFSYFNLYPSSPGQVSLSGWQSKISNEETKDVFIEWIYTAACIFKSASIGQNRFDESFGIYSYLEDLDFSLNFTTKNKKIVISSKSKFFHKVDINRSGYDFGILEVKNRLKIVIKYKFSKIRFLIMTLLRFSFFLAGGILLLNKDSFLRSIGNVVGIYRYFKFWL